MDHANDVAAGDEKRSAITVVTADSDHDVLSVSKAARMLSLARQGKKPEAADQPAQPAGAEKAAAAEPAPASPAEGDPESASVPDAPGGAETEGADPAQPTSVEPPKSWAKEDQDLFSSLPRATQERLAERERSRENDFLRRQGEIATKLEGLTAREQAAEQARRQYESAVVDTLQIVQAQHADQFADIKTPADIEKLAKDDPPRYVNWSEQQRQIANATAQVRAAQEQAASDAREQWSAFVKRQDELLAEHVPEMADAGKAVEMQGRAVELLKGIGFTAPELGQWWAGGLRPPLRDHRMQRLVLDAIKYRDAQRKAKEAAAKPVPPVQRPGVSQPRGAAQDAQIQALDKRLETTGSLKDAAALIAARRKAAR